MHAIQILLLGQLCDPQRILFFTTKTVAIDISPREKTKLNNSSGEVGSRSAHARITVAALLPNVQVPRHADMAMTRRGEGRDRGRGVLLALSVPTRPPQACPTRPRRRYPMAGRPWPATRCPAGPSPVVVSSIARSHGMFQAANQSVSSLDPIDQEPLSLSPTRLQAYQCKKPPRRFARFRSICS